MEYIKVTAENIDKEHVCCAIAKNDDCQVAAKKGWMKDRFADGLTFIKGDVRGKLFIEYIPAENAWAPLDATGYDYIDCFWISGQYKGHGYGRELLQLCIDDCRARGRKGLCIVSTEKKKMPFLADPKFLLHFGFEVADSCAPYFVLYYLPLSEGVQPPKFGQCIKTPQKEQGLTLYYADQCPYTAKYVPLIAAAAAESGIPLKTVHIETTEQAQAVPTPYTSFALFRDGKLLTHEMMTPQNFVKIYGNK